MGEAFVNDGPFQHDTARDGTAYWTASLYVGADRVRQFRDGADGTAEGLTLNSQNIAHWQINHWPSFALRNAIEPLFNDVADRDLHGKPQDFLFAAGLGRDNPRTGCRWASLTEGAQALLAETHLDVRSPKSFSWTTEGIEFRCHVPDERIRRVHLRRFWFVHNDGGISYHLSFSHFYGHDYGPSTYYFLSLMQKLLAPKEFALGDELLEQIASGERPSFSPFEAIDLGIDPIDRIEFAPALVDEPSETSFETGENKRFWPFVRDMFVDDAALLFGQVLCDPNPPPITDDAAQKSADSTYSRDVLWSLVKEVDFLEVPGLLLPRCRYMFHIQDQRFFDRLLPIDPVSGESLSRKQCVQDGCYQPYRDKIDALINTARHVTPRRVDLGNPGGDSDRSRFLDWSWVTERPEYLQALEEGCFEERVEDKSARPLATIEQLASAMHRGTAYYTEQGINPVPGNAERKHIPAFAPGRSDCLDYLFLSGFNQNIIDFMNQDPSEILDSTDPIYPVGDLQADERFFVRYANQRGMISYVPRSRSLEIGNDYIGTCPYAFLIHALAMHNEYLARDHERRSDDALISIDNEIRSIERDSASSHDDGKWQGLAERSRSVEIKINELKRAGFWLYERHRYLDVFRYDTEAKVFEKLEELRGIDRRTKALAAALEALEDYADDLDRRQRESQRKNEERRQRGLRAILGALGALSVSSLLFTLSDYFEKHPTWLWESSVPDKSFGSVLGNVAWILTLMGFGFIFYLAVLHRASIIEGLKKIIGRQSEHDGRS